MTDDQKRRMDETIATDIHTRVTEALALVEQWQSEHTNVADYRVNEITQSLRRAARYSGYLKEDTDPERDAVRAAIAQGKKL